MEHADGEHLLRLEQIELRDGELVLGGRTERESDSPMGRGEGRAAPAYSLVNRARHR
jgi:hypothetical protein